MQVMMVLRPCATSLHILDSIPQRPKGIARGLGERRLNDYGLDGWPGERSLFVYPHGHRCNLLLSLFGPPGKDSKAVS